MSSFWEFPLSAPIHTMLCCLLHGNSHKHMPLNHSNLISAKWNLTTHQCLTAATVLYFYVLIAYEQHGHYLLSKQLFTMPLMLTLHRRILALITVTLSTLMRKILLMITSNKRTFLSPSSCFALLSLPFSSLFFPPTWGM